MYFLSILGLSVERFASVLYKKLLPAKKLQARLRRYYRYWVLFEFLFDKTTKEVRKKDTFMTTPGRYNIFHGKASANFLFQLWTKEFIEMFSHYLLASVTDKNACILDVGAGNGALTHWLRKKGMNVIAVDNKSWLKRLERPEIAHRLKFNILPFPDWVLDMNFKKAIDIYQPEIIISSWMPSQDDWSYDFRACPSVKEYILIGEPAVDNYLDKCGEKETWQEHRGWTRTNLKDLDEVSLSWLDVIPECKGRKSIIVSYKRT